MKSGNYGIWLMPSGEAYKKMSKIISKLASEYNSPVFEPHVTLIHSIQGTQKDVALKTSMLARTIKPFKITLNKVGFQDKYYRCLFIFANESKHLVDANKKAGEVFNITPDEKSMPHLSLMYGDFPEEVKKKIIKKIGSSFDIAFEVESIHLYSGEGSVKDWHKVKEFKLGV